MSDRVSIHGEWSSRWAFILAATGSAVGLGNIWKFPYIAGENGGGAFVLVYLLCIALIGVPVMIAEIMLGRRGRRSPINAMRALASEEGRSSRWQYLGWIGVITGFLILSYYSVIAGWALHYVVYAIEGAFAGFSGESAKAAFGDMVADPQGLLFWHTLFMAMTLFVVMRGVRDGLEHAVRILMPLLFLLLLVLVGYAMTTGGFAQGITFLFAADFSVLSTEAVLMAMGHAFFTLSLGMGAIMVYGSYLPKNTSIARTTVTIASVDTLVALLAGIAIFPIVFANGLEPGAGPGLVFQTLPIAFGSMPAGHFFGILFFVLLVFAAWTSAISIIEPVVAWLVENHDMSRRKATLLAGIITWVVGIGTVLSFNMWSEHTLFGKTFFDLLDYLTSNILLPLGGMLIAIFVAWSMRKASLQDELRMHPSGFSLWYFVLRYFAPLAILLIFLNAIGVI